MLNCMIADAFFWGGGNGRIRGGLKGEGGGRRGPG